MHLAWRWFTGLGFDQEIPHHSTFSKNRHGRFQQSTLFKELFERIVSECSRVGLVKGEHLSVDGSFIQADANHDSRIPREQLAEAAQVNRTVRQYLRELEEQNGDGEAQPVHQQEKGSTTDPDATFLTTGKRPAELGYFDNYLVDNATCNPTSPLALDSTAPTANVSLRVSASLPSNCSGGMLVEGAQGDGSGDRFQTAHNIALQLKWIVGPRRRAGHIRGSGQRSPNSRCLQPSGSLSLTCKAGTRPSPSK